MTAQTEFARFRIVVHRRVKLNYVSFSVPTNEARDLSDTLFSVKVSVMVRWSLADGSIRTFGSRRISNRISTGVARQRRLLNSAIGGIFAIYQSHWQTTIEPEEHAPKCRLSLGAPPIDLGGASFIINTLNAVKAALSTALSGPKVYYQPYQLLISKESSIEPTG